jgi:hypothetical protein
MPPYKFMETYEIKFESGILNRGFWIYIIQIADLTKNIKYYYVGMTGDTGSINAASLFVRLGRHLDKKENARGNTLWRAIKREGIDNNKLSFCVKGFYLRKEEKQEEIHKKIRREISFIEDKLHKDLERVVCKVLGTQWREEKDILKVSKKEYNDIVDVVNEKFGLKVRK